MGRDSLRGSGPPVIKVAASEATGPGTEMAAGGGDIDLLGVSLSELSKNTLELLSKARAEIV